MRDPKLQEKWDDMYLQDNDSTENVSLSESKILASDFMDASIYKMMKEGKAPEECKKLFNDALEWYIDSFDWNNKN